MNHGIQAVLADMTGYRLAKELGVKPQAVTAWKRTGRVPGARVLAVERITGVPRHVIRPDLYPPPEPAQTA